MDDFGELEGFYGRKGGGKMIKKAITKVCFGIGYSIGTIVAGFEKAVLKECWDVIDKANSKECGDDCWSKCNSGFDSEGCEDSCETSGSSWW